jgi:hypothetical protein
MKFDYGSVNCSKDVLKFKIVLESFVVTIEPWQGRPNVGVSRKQSFEHIPMMACDLGDG